MRTWTIAQLAEEWGVRRQTVRHTLQKAGALDLCERPSPNLLLVTTAARRRAEAWREEHGRKGRAEPE